MALDITTLDPEKTVVVATGNAHKLIEIEAILAPVMPGVSFFALGELGDFPDPIEDGDTFTANAIIKAKAAREETGLAAVADDSGLVVDALGGAPGILSARYAGTHGDDAANNAKLLAELKDLPNSKRRAHFHSSVVLIRTDGSMLVGEGRCEGRIGHAARGSFGFGYDPLFRPDAAPGRAMAELSPEEKNAISHRFFALTDLARQLA